LSPRPRGAATFRSGVACLLPHSCEPFCMREGGAISSTRSRALREALAARAGRDAELARWSTAGMTSGRSERELAGTKAEIVRTALAVVRIAGRAARLRVTGGAARAPVRRTGAPPRLRVVRKRG